MKLKILQPVILFVSSIILIILLASSFWNGYQYAEVPLGIAPLIFLFLALISVILFYMVYLKHTDKKLTENAIREAVLKERSKLLLDLGKNKEQESTKDEDKAENVIKSIIPAGSFKTAESFAKRIMSNFAAELEISQGVFYLADQDRKTFSFLAGYALTSENPVEDFKLGENIHGQAASSQEVQIINEIPESYFEIESGLGKSKPQNLIIVPIVDKNNTIALLEMAIFKKIPDRTINMIRESATQIAEKLKKIQKS